MDLCCYFSSDTSPATQNLCSETSPPTHNSCSESDPEAATSDDLADLPELDSQDETLTPVMKLRCLRGSDISDYVSVITSDSTLLSNPFTADGLPRKF